MNGILKKIDDAAKCIEEKFGSGFNVAVILGSGLGKLMDEAQDLKLLDYSDIPGFPMTTAKGHAGQMITGKLGGRRILAMKGRFHYYEGHDISDVILPVRVFRKLGIDTLIATNAAGGINKTFRAGDLMVIRDHISFFAPSPLRGANLDELGQRFPDMTEAYSKRLIQLALQSARDLEIQVREGVYAFLKGPMYETPAEIKALGIMGADAVGMSTVPEVITARHMGMEVLGISCITNMAAGISEEPLNHEEVLTAARRTEKDFSRLIAEIIRRIE
ncbi:MAG TPA: purine-nucleoside phosphorylase [Clostridiaceae bacterium]|nr:purine-nucleoside phosphorylase [Clostridiaceae bacterium]